MSRQLHKLSALQVRRLDRIGRHGDGGGLYLSIGKDGRRARDGARQRRYRISG